MWRGYLTNMRVGIDEYLGKSAGWIEDTFELEKTKEIKEKVVSNNWLKEIKSMRSSRKMNVYLSRS